MCSPVVFLLSKSLDWLVRNVCDWSIIGSPVVATLGHRSYRGSTSLSLAIAIMRGLFHLAIFDSHGTGHDEYVQGDFRGTHN